MACSALVGTPDLVVVGPCLLDKRPAGRGVDQRPRDADGTGGVLDVDHRPRVVRRDLDGSVGAGRRRTADQQRHRKARALHFRRHRAHLLQRGRDEAGQPDQVGDPFTGRLKDLRPGHHHAEVDHLVVVAAEHNADDVLPDVVDIALDGGHDDRAGAPAPTGCRVTAARRLLGLDERHKMRDGLLHDAGALDDLRQEHATAAEQVADHVHARHQRALDDVDRVCRRGAGLLGVGDDPVGDPVHQRVGQPLPHRGVAPREVGPGFGACPAAGRIGDLEETLSRVRSPVEHDVLHALPEVGGDIVVDGQRPGVDDSHVHAGGDPVVQEDGVDCLADGVVATERERDVGHAAADEGARQFRLDAASRLEVGQCVAGVLLDARYRSRRCSGRG